MHIYASYKDIRFLLSASTRELLLIFNQWVHNLAYIAVIMRTVILFQEPDK